LSKLLDHLRKKRKAGTGKPKTQALARSHLTSPPLSDLQKAIILVETSHIVFPKTTGKKPQVSSPIKWKE